jgi:glycosyltransferase involved in cell wall biosynthesis
LLRELGLEGDVRFVHGVSVDDLVRLYAEASVAVVPSLYEGFSLPAIEAMACGVPLIATAAGGVPEVVGRDGDAAIVIPPGDIPALITAIERVLDDPELAGCLGHAGRARAVGCFNWRRTAALTADQYREVLAAC